MEKIKLYSDQVMDILSKPPRSITRWGNSLTLVFVSMLFLLSWIIKYPDIVVAPAVISTQQPSEKIIAKTEAKLAQLFVDNNQPVDSGTILAVLENPAQYEDVIHLKSVIDANAARLDSFYFPLESLPVLFLGEIEHAFSEFENNYIQYVLNKTLDPNSKDVMNQQYSLEQLQFRLENLNEQQLFFQKELLQMDQELKKLMKLNQKEMVSNTQIEQKELLLLQTKRRAIAVANEISIVKENISVVHNNVSQIDIKKQRANINTLKSVLQSYDQLQLAIRKWEQQYLLKTHSKGRVSFFDDWFINQNLSNGQMMFSVIPEEQTKYIAKLKASSKNLGKVKIGQSVLLKLDAYPNREFGVIRGEVSRMSPVANSTGEYLIHVTLPKTLETSFGHQIDFQQELSAVGEIVTKDLRLLQRIMFQFSDMFKYN